MNTPKNLAIVSWPTAVFVKEEAELDIIRALKTTRYRSNVLFHAPYEWCEGTITQNIGVGAELVLVKVSAPFNWRIAKLNGRSNRFSELEICCCLVTWKLREPWTLRYRYGAALNLLGGLGVSLEK